MLSVKNLKRNTINSKLIKLVFRLNVGKLQGLLEIMGRGKQPY